MGRVARDRVLIACSAFWSPWLWTTALTAQEVLPVAPKSYSLESSYTSEAVKKTPAQVNSEIAHEPQLPSRSGPLASLGATLSERGVNVDLNFYDYYQANPSTGLRVGNQSNSGYFVLGMTADLQRLANISGGTIHFTETFFGLVRNTNLASDIGDTTVGYQPPFTPNNNRLSLLTYEQKLLDDRFVIEVGRTQPGRYYGIPPCNSLNSCFQDIFYFNAGFTAPLFAVWGVNVAYNISASNYIQAGVFSVNPGTNRLSGYDWGYEKLAGALTMVEIGHKTDYSTVSYPGRVSLTGYYSSADHDDNFRTISGASKGLHPGEPVLQRTGTAGVVLTGRQTVWRADDGLEQVPHPTAISVYTGTGYAFDPTIPIRFNTFVGLLLEAPDQRHPQDTFGVKINWQRLAENYTQFLSDANVISGGSGMAYSRDKFIFEVNGHFDVGAGVVVEPVLQYVVNPNSYYDPYTAKRAKDGFYGGFSLVVPIGNLLGLVPG